MRALRFSLYVLTLLALMPVKAALAKEYDIEIVLFENLFA